jgi:V8-like Glu-specific endopeptidase
VILHFRNANFAANAVLEVDLGYATDQFTAADGDEFWTRPINVAALPGNQVPIRYITTGAVTGGVELDQYGRGERQEEEPDLSGTPDFQSLSNCDPFLVQPNPPNQYMEPDYATHWFCAGSPPNWENAQCVSPPADIRNAVAAAVGMIVTVDDEWVSSCSVTLISPNRVIMAGHCIADPGEETFSSSVTFDYAVNCNGHIPNNYNARFHKVVKLIKFRNKTINGLYYDYSVLELAVPPGGLGITPLVMRNDLPAVGEQVFGVHHPNGAVKKLSIPHPGYATVAASSAGAVEVSLDVSGGSSGSGLFDTAGRIVGVLSNGPKCGLNYFPTATILPDLNAAEPEITRDVMIVFDRSGSMSLDAGTGKTKIEEARDAASLFIQLVRSDTGNRAGLVAFSSTADIPFHLAAVNAANKLLLVGPAPYTGGAVGALVPGGSTTIGGGLQTARSEFPMQLVNLSSILLLTDGLQNTPPMINTVVGQLNGIDINVIGYGTESSLDGELLTGLASAHNGLYTRAMSPLHLKKFFSLAFGNIFEAGAAVDPEYFLSKGSNTGAPVTFDICGEENVTIVIGWDTEIARLDLRVSSPGGNVIQGNSPGVEQATGRTWTFLRFKLPYDGERDGQWKIDVFRSAIEGEPRPVDVNYFVNVIVDGGPKLELMPVRRKYYTGDTINPLVALKYRDGTHPPNAKVKVEVNIPATSVGNVLTGARLREPMPIDADTIPARQATLLALEAESGKPAVSFAQQTFELFDDPASTGGFFEPAGVYGNPLADLLRTEGNYTFHFRATYGEGCTATRELFWTLHVDTGIDPARTDLTTTSISKWPDGKRLVKITIVPRDQYGNYLGPGRLEALTITGATGTTPTEQPQDNRDGSYSITAIWDPSASPSPGVVISQTGRPPVIVLEPGKGQILPEPAVDQKLWLWLLLIVIVLLLLIIIVLLLR